MNTKKETFIDSDETGFPNNTHLTVRPAIKNKTGHLNQLFEESQQLLKEVKSGFAEDIVSERKR